MNDKETIELLIKRLDSQQRQINEINLNILPWMIGVEEKLSAMRSELDEMYYTKGADLIDNQQKRLQQFHRIVLEEFDLNDDSIFYSKGRGRYNNLPEDALFARNTLMYMLNKHIKQFTIRKLSALYGIQFSNLSSEYKKYLNNPVDRQVIDRIDNRITEMLRLQRPFDGQND
jgi:hypothetical protein